MEEHSHFEWKTRSSKKGTRRSWKLGRSWKLDEWRALNRISDSLKLDEWRTDVHHQSREHADAYDAVHQHPNDQRLISNDKKLEIRIYDSVGSSMPVAPPVQESETVSTPGENGSERERDVPYEPAESSALVAPSMQESERVSMQGEKGREREKRERERRNTHDSVGSSAARAPPMQRHPKDWRLIINTVAINIDNSVRPCVALSRVLRSHDFPPLRQREEVSCSALQCVAVRCGVLQSVALSRSSFAAPDDKGVLQCIAAFCFVFQCVAVCCSVLRSHDLPSLHLDAKLSVSFARALSLSLSLSFSLCVSLSLSVSIYLSLSAFLSICRSLSCSFFLSLSLSLFLSLSLLFFRSLSLSFFLYLSLCLSLAISLSLSLSLSLALSFSFSFSFSLYLSPSLSFSLFLPLSFSL